MKKTVLVVLIAVVMFATPCLAQIKSQGLFSINDTLWETAHEGEGIYLDKTAIGFSESKIFLSSFIWFPTECEQSHILNFGVLSFYSASCESFGEATSNISGFASSLLEVGIYWRGEFPNVEVEIIEKIEDDWNPSESPFPGGPPIDIIIIDPYPDDIFDDPIE